MRIVESDKVVLKICASSRQSVNKTHTLCIVIIVNSNYSFFWHWFFANEFQHRISVDKFYAKNDFFILCIRQFSFWFCFKCIKQSVRIYWFYGLRILVAMTLACSKIHCTADTPYYLCKIQSIKKEIVICLSLTDFIRFQCIKSSHWNWFVWRCQYNFSILYSSHFHCRTVSCNKTKNKKITDHWWRKNI